MVYIYRTVVASGTNEGVEGVSKGMASISLFMQDCGWDLVEDRSTEPATGFDNTHMKYVFSSNGEEGNYPTFYMTLYSGSATGINADTMYMVAHTAYDTGTHLTPASGVRTAVGQTAALAKPNDTNADNRLLIYSQTDDTEIYMAGDSEMVHLITRKVNDNNSASTMDNSYFGRFNSFLSVDRNPYPLIVVARPGALITTSVTSFPRGIWGNPPQSSPNRTHVTIQAPTTIADANMPYINGVDSIFTALPLIVYYNTTTGDPVKGVVGTVRNGWVSSDGTSMFNLSILTASGTGGAQEYISFTHETTTTTPSIVVRKS